MSIPVFCLDWHINQTPSQQALLIEPLAPYMLFNRIGWDGSTLISFQSEWLKNSPIVFYQLPPPESVFNFPDARIIWIPMWDQARGYDREWWSRLPKSLRVVSFSKEVSQRARAVGLNTFDVRYFMPPSDYGQADWNKPRTLFYWNRTGMVGEVFLRKLCDAIDVEILLFRQRIDPRVASWCDYELPEKIGRTVVKKLTFASDGADAHYEYLKYLSQANIFIAPRLFEGVGLSFIEALASGCAVFAYDAPTMNEYIIHKTNGYLLQQSHKTIFNMIYGQMTKKMQRVANHFGYAPPSLYYPVTERQNWAEIKKLDVQSLGNQARQGQLEGYEVWKSCLPDYASFILDW